MNFYEQKQELRRQVRSAKRLHSAETLSQLSEQIAERLKCDETFRNAKCVLFYWSLPDEVDTHALIGELLGQKQIILPKVVDNDIIPIELHSLNDLAVGEFGICEPQGTPFKGKIDLVIVPGMAFDSTGHRLGRGKGFYDRFLSSFPGIATIGLAFDFQLFEHIPTEPHDKKVDCVVTNK